jgi:hypothetical protein
MFNQLLFTSENMFGAKVMLIKKKRENPARLGDNSKRRPLPAGMAFNSASLWGAGDR